MAERQHSGGDQRDQAGTMSRLHHAVRTSILGLLVLMVVARAGLDRVRCAVQEGPAPQRILAPREPRLGLTVGKRIERLRWRPGGEALAAVCGDKRVRLWSMKDGAPLADIPGLAAAWSPDGRSLAVSASALEIRTGPKLEFVARISALSSHPRGLAWSPDGTYQRLVPLRARREAVCERTEQQNPCPRS